MQAVAVAMPTQSYINLDVKLRRGHGAGRFAVDMESPAGDHSAAIRMPFTAEELTDLFRSVEGPARDVEVGNTVSAQQRSAYRDQVLAYGKRLFESVFDRRSRAILVKLRASGGKQRRGVRIRLHLDETPELASLPGEYLYDPDLAQCIAVTSPIVRYSQVDGDSPSALVVKPPLRILVMTANPPGHMPIAVDQEWSQIQSTLDGLCRANVVELQRVPGATIDDLLTCLRRDEWHIFHFIGHGGGSSDDPVLLLEDEHGRPREITRSELSYALQHPTLRLVVLNSCNGARSPHIDPFGSPFGSLAHGLVESRIPAVIAMQFKITDQGAIKFARELYAGLADNLPIDQVLTEARKAMFLARNPTEWGTPVLFMRGEDGRLFEIDQPTPQQLVERQIAALASETHAAIDARRYDVAINNLLGIKRLTAT
jgi:hypothetical protein